MSRIGFVLDGKYEILSEIGRGGMSIVYLARDRRLNKLWAVKEFQKTGVEMKDEVFRESLLVEANLMKSLDHKALPRIEDIIETQGTIFIVMDYVEGENLKKVMKRQGHPMSEAEVIDWGIQLCDVLDYLHTPDSRKGKPVVVYRDMKPENVMLKDDGTVCLIDFGIARKFDSNKAGDTTILGTREYAAPEQMDASSQTDPRADIYSLGVTLHYLVTGHNPKQNIFQTQPIRVYNPQLSEGLEAVIAKCVAYDREARYQSCREVAYDLEHHESLTAEYRSRLKGKIHTFAALAIAAVVFLAVGIFGMTMSNLEKQSTFEAYLNQGNNIALVNEEAQSGNDAYDEKVEAYENAIDVDASQSEPYEKLLDTFIADGTFSSEEADTYYKLLEGSAQKSCAKDEYSQLCYDFANVYFCYTENYSQASMWFTNAINAGGLDAELESNAATYIAISDFRTNLDSKDILNNLGESSAYVEYWDGLCDAFDALEEANVTPRSKLKLYELIVYACSSTAYVNPLKNGGKTEDELTDQLDEVYRATKALDDEIVSAIDRELYEYIMLHCNPNDDGGSSIDTAYEVVQNFYNGTIDTAKSSTGTSGTSSTSGSTSAASSDEAGE